MNKFIEIFQHFFDTDYSSLRIAAESHFQIQDVDFFSQENSLKNIDLITLNDEQILMFFLLHFGKA
jgi:hypothetical protein